LGNLRCVTSLYNLLETVTMHLRLVHTLSLLLLGVILAAVLAFGGMLAWNLRSGFNDYLLARDSERLEQFATLVSEHVRTAGGFQTFVASGIDLPQLLAEFGERQGLPLRSGLPGRPPGPPAGRPPEMDLPPGPGPRPMPPGPEGFGAALGIYAPGGALALGVPLNARSPGSLERDVMLDGKVVASVRMSRAERVPDEVEAAFLQRQYLGIALLAGVLSSLGLLGARWLAGRWVRPLLAVQNATARIAHGELATRLSASRRDEIGDLMRNINSMAEGLEHLEGARRRWIAEISHELRTPLTVLRGEIDALAEGVRPLTHDAVTSLREEVLRLAAMIDDLHLLAMADLNALPCYFAECDAVQLVERVHQRFARRASVLGISLEIETRATNIPLVFWDAQRMEQVLTNLLENSLCYTDAPGRVRLTIERQRDRVWMRVDDSEPGVPTADLGRLFDPLYRSDASRSRHRGGSGLGLAICAALVRAHAGQITAAASELGGLSILIDMPLIAGPPR
jgi:two-component system sensor histidine kinase BaeS